MKYVPIQDVGALAVWVEEILQEDRWDAEFVRPDYLESHEVILNAKGFSPTLLGSLLVHETGLTGGETPLGADYPSSGIPFLRVQNIDKGYIDLSDRQFISEQMDRAIARSRLE